MHVTIFPRGKRRKGSTKTLTVYETTVEQMAKIIRDAVAATTPPGQSDSSAA